MVYNSITAYQPFNEIISSTSIDGAAMDSADWGEG